MPYFFGSGTGPMVVAIALAVLAAISVGTLLARFTGRSAVRSAARQLFYTAVPAVLTYALGSAVGVTGIG